MAKKEFEIAVVLSAIDKMSRGIDEAVTRSVSKLNDFQKRSDKIAKQSFSDARTYGAMGIAMLAPMAYANKLFTQQESAALDLGATMLDVNGQVGDSFKALEKMSVDLGAKYIGTTTDMLNLAANLKNAGLSDKAILGGGAETSAMFANLNKLDFNSVSTFFAKTIESTGTAEKDYLELFDTIHKGFQSFPGAPADKMNELQQFFSTSQAGLKTLGKTGIEETKKIAAIGELFIKNGMSGASSGTAFNRVLLEMADPKKYGAFKAQARSMGLEVDLLDKKTGRFNVEAFLNGLDKINKLSGKQQISLFRPLAGPEGKDLTEMLVLTKLGKKGFDDFISQQQKHANIVKQMDFVRQGEAFKLETLGGNFENSMAAFAKTMQPVFIKVIDKITDFLGGIDKFMVAHPTLTKYGAGGIVTGGLAALGISAAFWAKGIFNKGKSLFAGAAKNLAQITGGAAKSSNTIVQGLAGKSGGAVAAGGEAAAAGAKGVSFFAKVSPFLRKSLGAAGFIFEQGSEATSGHSYEERQKMLNKNFAIREREWQIMNNKNPSALSNLKSLGQQMINHIHYNPVVHVAAGVSVGEFEKSLKTHENVIMRIINEATRVKDRTKF